LIFTPQPPQRMGGQSMRFGDIGVGGDDRL